MLIMVNDPARQVKLPNVRRTGRTRIPERRLLFTFTFFGFYRAGLGHTQRQLTGVCRQVGGDLPDGKTVAPKLWAIEFSVSGLTAIGSYWNLYTFRIWHEFT